MLVYGGGGPEMFLKVIPKGHSQFTYLILLSACLGTFEPKDCHTLIGDIILVFGGHQEVPDGIYPIKMHFYTPFITNTLECPFVYGTTIWIFPLVL